MENLCLTCKSVSNYIDYCSVPCQFIGNNILELPNEMIEQIVSNMDGKSIVELAKIDLDFRRWLFKHNPSYYFDKLDWNDIKYFKSINNAFENWFNNKYIIEVANNIKEGTNGEVFKFKNHENVKLQLLIDEPYDWDKKLIVSTDLNLILMGEFLKTFKLLGIYLKIDTDVNERLRYRYSMDFDIDIELFIETIFRNFGFILKTSSTYCLVLICTPNNLLFRIQSYPLCKTCFLFAIKANCMKTNHIFTLGDKLLNSRECLSFKI